MERDLVPTWSSRKHFGRLHCTAKTRRTWRGKAATNRGVGRDSVESILPRIAADNPRTITREAYGVTNPKEFPSFITQSAEVLRGG